MLISPFQDMNRHTPFSLKQSLALVLLNNANLMCLHYAMYSLPRVISMSKVIVTRGVHMQGKYVRALVGLSREAPSMFKAAGHYFLFTSGCTGWEPNRAEIFYATCASASLRPSCVAG